MEESGRSRCGTLLLIYLLSFSLYSASFYSHYSTPLYFLFGFPSSIVLISTRTNPRDSLICFIVYLSSLFSPFVTANEYIFVPHLILRTSLTHYIRCRLMVVPSLLMEIRLSNFQVKSNKTIKHKRNKKNEIT